MYALFVGTKQSFILDSVYEENQMVCDPGMPDIVLPAWRVRISQMASLWKNHGTYRFPANEQPEQLLGYSSSDSTASDVITQMDGGFFAFCARENASGEIHLWNSRYSAVFEFNIREDAIHDTFACRPDDDAWYVRTLSYPGTLDQYVWDGSQVDDVPVINRKTILRANSPKAKALGLGRYDFYTDDLINAVKPQYKWSYRHLTVLREIAGHGEVMIRNIDNPQKGKVNGRSH